ncbi:MAG: hypothetical protein U0L74_01230 [Paludibacteraceae bacterium]|jgi:hypothetical protein|nr:hypothetical protein [Paludibacteraceae bacterium]
MKQIFSLVVLSALLSSCAGEMVTDALLHDCECVNENPPPLNEVQILEYDGECSELEDEGRVCRELN